MRTKLLLCLFAFAAFLLLTAGRTLKGGPGNPTSIHEATFYVDDTSPGVGECADAGGGDDGLVGSCKTVLGTRTHVAYETDSGYSRIALHRLFCVYEDGDDAIIDAADQLEFCVIYYPTNIDTGIVETTACLDWVNVDATAGSMKYLLYDTTVYIPHTEVGLMLRIKSTTDADTDSDFRGACKLEYSGAH